MIDLKKIPDKPGIYIYRDKLRAIIYIGKAINLRKRVSQYFQRHDALGPKTEALVSRINSVYTKVVDSEIAALILEAAYIKKYKPKFNSLLKDDRSYTYICISKDKFPRVYTAFASTKVPDAEIYGPFPGGRSVQTLLKTLRHIFPYYSQKKHPKHPCLYCHLNMCPGPDPDLKEYRRNISYIKKILNGRFVTLTHNLKKDMLSASKAHDYELAIEYRNQLTSLQYIVTGWRALSEFYEKIDLPEDRYSSAISELLTTLSPYFKFNAINRIECYDISQMGTKYFVGSMVVFQYGQLNPGEYRKFKINTKLTPDDQFMMKEVVWRRLRHPEWKTPDLIIVDGGKPQVSSVSGITDRPVVGLAKRQETIVIKDGVNWREISLPKSSHALHLLQTLRDEAHRFANSYRKLLMKKNLIK